jgi:hypothetical protein
MAAMNKFNAFIADIHNKIHALNSDTLKICLTNSAPVATNTVYANITDLSTANGYTAGGTALASVTSTQTSGTYTLNAANLTIVTATGAVGPFRYAVLYNFTAASQNLIVWWDYGTSITLANTETFTITFSGGIFTAV